jgi:hypothetical protein
MYASYFKVTSIVTPHHVRSREKKGSDILTLSLRRKERKKYYL